jgi:hypothetical protein
VAVTSDYAPTAAEVPARAQSALRRWPLFLLIGLALYAALYLWAESVVRAEGERNRFFMIANTPPTQFDTVILGASHAMPLGYGDFNQKLEAASAGKVMSLSMEGAGVVPNRLVLDYFFSRHETKQVVFFADSFGFYSRQWNEDRLDDSVLARAPFDPALVETLARYPWAQRLILPYVSGFTKINNQKRFESDRSEAELTKFEKTYRPIPQIDKQRTAYLYPAGADKAALQRYLGELDALSDLAAEHGARLVLVKPPTPPRFRDVLPEEPAFDAAIERFAAERNLIFRDFSTLLPDDANYFDTDHMNPTGVQGFIDGGFAALLRGE